MKTITIFSKHFWPENFKINDICLKLKNKYKINVFTSTPGYNNVKYKKKFKGKIKFKGINIRYFSTYVRMDNNFLSIFFDYFSYVLNLLFKINFHLKPKSNISITFATSPIFQALPAIYYSKIKKIPSIIWVQDLWPEVLEDTGYIKNKIILNIIDGIVKLIYSKSDLILAQSKSFEKHLKKKYKIKNKIFTLHQPSEYKFQKNINLKKRNKYIVYAGNFGTAQDFDTIIDAFSSNKINKNISLRLIGSGKKFNYIKNRIKNAKLEKKIILLNYENNAKLNKILKYSSAFFITLKNGKSLNKTIPGKFQTYISFGKPLIICSCGDLNNFILQNKLGFASKPTQVKKLINNINKIDNLSLIQKNKIYLSSKKVYERLFDIKKVTKRLEEFINFTLKNHVKKSIL